MRIVDGGFEIPNDAGETFFVSRNVLIHVEKEVMDRVRPRKFREILQVDSSIPDWAEGYSFDRVEVAANWLPVQEYGEEFVTANAKISTEQNKLVELMSGYRYGAREMIRAQKTNIPLDTARANAVMQKGEELLEWVAINGTIDGTKQLGSFTGLFNTPGATTLTGGDAILGTTSSWEDRFVAATTADARDTACEVVITDCLKFENVSERVTKETTPIDTLVLPLSTREIFQRTKTYTESTIEQLLLRRAKYIKRLVFWAAADLKAMGIDGTHKRRIVGLASQDTDAARFVLPRSPVPGANYQLMTGAVHVPVTAVVGGFNTKMPSSIIYGDLEDQP